jgi:GNAT superfamily N-acetyltransferase
MMSYDNDPMWLWDNDHTPPDRNDFPEGDAGTTEWTKAWEAHDAAREEYQMDAPDREERLLEHFSDLLDGEFVAHDGKTYSSSVAMVDDVDGGVMVSGTLLDNRGNQVGTYDRVFNLEGYVYHSHLRIYDEAQSRGIGSTFNARNEQLYRAMGYDEIRLQGSSSSNGYKGATHWPKNGYDWADDENKEKFLTIADAAISLFESDIRAGGDGAINRAEIVGQDEAGMPIYGQMPVFDSAEQAIELSELIAMARDEDLETGTIRAGDLLNWPGAEDFFAQREASIDYRRSI